MAVFALDAMEGLGGAFCGAAPPFSSVLTALVVPTALSTSPSKVLWMTCDAAPDAAEFCAPDEALGVVMKISSNGLDASPDELAPAAALEALEGTASVLTLAVLEVLDGCGADPGAGGTDALDEDAVELFVPEAAGLEASSEGMAMKRLNGLDVCPDGSAM